MKWLENWKDISLPKFSKEPQKRRRIQTDVKRPKSKVVGKPVENHEAKERWKHINERPY